jgi:hypothetical protein
LTVCHTRSWLAKGPIAPFANGEWFTYHRFFVRLSIRVDHFYRTRYRQTNASWHASSQFMCRPFGPGQPQGPTDRCSARRGDAVII